VATGQDAARISLRPLESPADFHAALDLQKEIWGFEEIELLPLRLFVVARKVGGQVIGAFDDSAVDRPMIGFLLAIPGLNKDGAYLHSHMMGVRARYRNLGVGRRLKLAQREEALQRGIRLIEWTFDPLEIKNAYLNLHKLGAIACRYEEDFYGFSSSRLQGGLPTDRLVAEWELDSPRVEAILKGRPFSGSAIVKRITVPASIYEWKASEDGRERALTVQLENRRRFQLAFAKGLAVLGFSLDAEGNGVYELGCLKRADSKS